MGFSQKETKLGNGFKRKFNLFYKKQPQISVYATNEKEAWKKMRQAGIYNKSNVFELLDIETNKLDQIDINLGKKMVNKIVNLK